jgi:hypothetical protein
MALGMNFLDGAHVYVDVAHCCLDVGVAHERLHIARVRPVLNQGRTERVAQLVRMNVATQNIATQLLDNQERRLPREWGTTRFWTLLASEPEEARRIYEHNSVLWPIAH